jgi:periplasmic protein TonB
MGAEGSREIVDIVLGVGQRPNRRALPGAALASLAAHAGLVVLLASATTEVRPRAKPPDLAVELSPTEPPKEPEPVVPPPEPPAAQPSPAARETRQAQSPPAAAAKVIAQEPTGPVDLTSDVVFTGNAAVFAGGITSSTGTSTHAVETPIVDRPVEPSRPKARSVPRGPDRSQPALPSESDWHCAWPREAEMSDLDQQTVQVRVEVLANGTPRSAKAITNPGFGFAKAAVDCALSAHFEPARDSDGRPILAMTPPVRVRFWR